MAFLALDEGHEIGECHYVSDSADGRICGAKAEYTPNKEKTPGTRKSVVTEPKHSTVDLIVLLGYL